MTITLQRFTSSEAAQLAASLRDVYAAAFGEPPYCEPASSAARFGESFLRHSTYAGFRGLVAREDDTVIGFVYGYTSASGQWWHDVVARGIGPELTAVWLSDAFEVVDLAVLPAFQGRGAGRLLHDTLLRELPYRTAVLSTRNQETTALRLYRRAGWTPIAVDFRFPGGDASWLILGLTLPVPE